jgi:hypothetical protein
MRNLVTRKTQLSIKLNQQLTQRSPQLQVPVMPQYGRMIHRSAIIAVLPITSPAMRPAEKSVSAIRTQSPPRAKYRKC